MKALKLRISEELYARFKRLHPAYGEESRVFRELLEAYVKHEEKFRKLPMGVSGYLVKCSKD